jgi:single-strand DNA-binding protein
MMKAFGVGRFVADPTIQTVGEGEKQSSVCKFSLAINEYRKVGGERKKFPHYFDFEVWDKAAELICKYRQKGDLLEFYATARQQKWNDKDTGEPRSKVVFRLDDFTFLPKGGQHTDSAEKTEPEEDSPF